MGLKISTTKTLPILFTRNTRCDTSIGNLKIDNTTLALEKEVIFLGVCSTNNLLGRRTLTTSPTNAKPALNLMRCVSGTTYGASKQTLLIMYKALIRSLLDYEAIAYDSADISTKEKLYLLRAMARCARSCLQIECGQPPLSLRRRRMQVDYALKIQSDVNHPTATIMDDC